MNWLFNWFENVVGIELRQDRPELGPVHTYARRGSLQDFHFGNRCLWCKERDDERRRHTDKRCTRTLIPE